MHVFPLSFFADMVTSIFVLYTSVLLLLLLLVSIFTSINACVYIRYECRGRGTFAPVRSRWRAFINYPARLLPSFFIAPSLQSWRRRQKKSRELQGCQVGGVSDAFK